MEGQYRWVTSENKLILYDGSKQSPAVFCELPLFLLSIFCERASEGGINGEKGEGKEEDEWEREGTKPAKSGSLRAYIFLQ